MPAPVGLPAPPVLVGREDILEQISVRWSQGDPHIVLTGPDGIGKTSILSTFLGRTGGLELLAWNCRKKFDTQGLLGTLQGLLGEAVDTGTSDDVEGILHSLSNPSCALRRPGVVLVLNDAPEGDAMLDDFLERAPLRWIATSRTPRGGAVPIGVSPLDTDASIHMIQDVAGPHSAKLAERCEGRPQALHLCRMTLLKRVCTVSDLLQDGIAPWIEARRRLMQWVPDLPREVFLALCALRSPLPPEDLHEMVLISTLVHSVRNALQDLVACGLVEEAINKDYWVHPLIRNDVLARERLEGVHEWIAARMRPRRLFAEDLIHHRCAAGLIQTACADFDRIWGGTARLLQQRESGQALRLSRMLVDALQAPDGWDIPRRDDLPWLLLTPARTADPPGTVWLAQTLERTNATASILERMLLPVWRAALAFAPPSPLVALAPERAKALAGKLFDHGLALHFTGQVQQASIVYRRGLRLARRLGLQDKVRGFLFAYIDCCVRRGYLPLAARLATAVRRLCALQGRPVREPAAWSYLWHAQCLMGVPTVEIRTVLRTLPPGPSILRIIDVALRRERTHEAWAMAQTNVETSQDPVVVALSRIFCLEAGLMDESLLDAARAAYLPADDPSQLMRWCPPFLRIHALSVSARLSADLPRRRHMLLEALDLARRYGYRLLEMDMALHLARLSEDNPGDGAPVTPTPKDILALSRRPHIRYAWAEYRALEMLGDGQALPLRDRLFPPPPPVRSPGVEPTWPCPLALPDVPVLRPFSAVLPLPWGPGLPPLIVPYRRQALQDRAFMSYEAHLRSAWAEAHQAREDIGLFYELVALVVLGGASPQADEAVEALAQAEDVPVNPLLVETLRLAVRPSSATVDTLARHLADRPLSRLRSLAAWQAGAVYEGLGDVDKATEMYELCRPIEDYDEVHSRRRQLGREPHRATCSVAFSAVVEALEAWRRTHPQVGYPAMLDLLLPRWMTTVPGCPVSGDALYYRVNRHRNRYVVGCRRHYRLYDSSLGDLGRKTAVELPAPIGLGRQALVAAVVTRPLAFPLPKKPLPPKPR